MLIRRWEKLPAEMQTDEVRKYYDILRKKNFFVILEARFRYFCFGAYVDCIIAAVSCFGDCNKNRQ